jgi:hypothetical protein
LATYSLPNNISNGDTPDATVLMGNFDYIENTLNDHDGANITDATITDAKLVNDPTSVRDETIPNQVISGLTITDPGATLTGVIAAGVAYIDGVRTSVNSSSNAYTASKDTYADLSKTGTFTYIPVANGAASPALTANSIRLAKVVTNGTEIASVTQSSIDSLGNVIYPVVSNMFSMPYTSWNILPTGLETAKATVVAKYQKVNKTVNFYIEATMTAADSIIDSVVISLPVTSTTRLAYEPIGNIIFLNADGNITVGVLIWTSTGTATVKYIDPTDNALASISATLPFDWEATDKLLITGSYEAA